MLKECEEIESLNQFKLKRHLFTDESILCMSRTKLLNSVNKFLFDFPGTTLYAVKCNPHPLVIQAMINMGIKHFDTASLHEIKLIHAISTDVKSYFNHPVKSRREISEAYYQYNIKDFVVDSPEEFEKIVSEVPENDLTIQCRLNTQTGSNIYDFSQKFGMAPKEAINLIELIISKKMEWALSFHVGSQCIDISAYVKALDACQLVIDALQQKPKYINVGGGFPANYPNIEAPNVGQYFEIIREFKEKHDLPQLLCEPGRALVAEAGFLIIQIVLRNQHKLYLNNGVYGALGEINYAQLKLNVGAISFNRTLSDKYCEYKIFGPTCDSFDTIDHPFSLPENISEGDWIILSSIGAYSTSLSSNFNGFSSNKVVMIP